MKDFKSLIYKQNEMNELSIERLAPILEKRLPYHLFELKIVDCRINSTQITILMNLLVQKSQLRAFSLVNVHHSE